MTQIEFNRTEELLPRLEESDYPKNARRMMRAAVFLFAQRGYAGTSVREIVQAADVTNPMLYYYFDNKEGLFNTLITFLFETITRDIDELLEGADSLVDAVDGIINVYFQACKRSPTSLKFVFSVLFGPEESAPSFDIFDVRQQMVDEIVGLIEGAVEAGQFEINDELDPSFLTEQLLGMITNHLMRALKKAEGAPSRAERHQRMRKMMTEEIARNLRQFYFFGAGTPADI